MALKTSARIGGLLLLALFLGGANGGGCGGKNVFEGSADKSGTDAALEAARIAIDQKDYSSAIATLTGLCGASPTAPSCDPPTVSLLASAYMGRAGVDTLLLIGNAENVGSGPCAFTLFSKFFSQQTSQQLLQDQADLNTSLALLNAIPNRTADQYFQLELAAIFEMAVELGLAGGGYTSSGTVVTLPSSPGAIPAATVTSIDLDQGYVQAGLTGSGLAQQKIGQTIAQVLSALSSVGGTGAVNGDGIFAFLQLLNGSGC